MNKITEMMGRMMRGMKGKGEALGPVGQATEVLEGAIKTAKERRMYDGSPIFNSMAVLLDHARKVRAALHIAVAIVNELEEVKEWSPENARRMAGLIQSFKDAAVKARLHQKFLDEGERKH